MSIDIIDQGYYKIKPAGRHIITIGRDLIKDKYAAIVELVKNSYDADSPYCKVSLLPFIKEVIINEITTSKKGIRIEIKDEGHGMELDTVINKWMVPSTDDKFLRKISPLGRMMQGRKGVGRYAASMLGDDLVLETIHDSGFLTTLYLVWKDFEDAKYLEDVNILIESKKTEKKPGTDIIIVGDEKHLNDWTSRQIQNLRFELKKLIPPINKEDENIEQSNKPFKIILEIGQFTPDGQMIFGDVKNVVEEIEPYPLFELYDYRISGTVSHLGIANLTFHNNRSQEDVEHIHEFKIFLNQNSSRKNEEAYCGKIKIDFRVFDRDPASIDGLIGRGLKDPVSGQYVGRKEARLILDSFNGIGVYRNKFRLRPLGDAGYDWLELDKERVQNPSVKIGSDQIIGFIHIQSEEDSGLEEKSARDGLKETPQYFGLQEICKQVLLRLEQRRFIYRKNIGLGRSNRNLEDKINTLYNFAELKEKINVELEASGIGKEEKEKINNLITEKEQKSSKVAEELKQAIAQYQGQATVGKIVNVILHEGRKPLGYFKNQIPLINEWREELKEEYNIETLEKIVDRLAVLDEQSNIFIKLFAKLDPLSSRKREPKKDFLLRTVLENIKDVFLQELEAQEISYNIQCDLLQTCYGWKEDFYITFTNLVDNSIYWFKSPTNHPKEIHLKVYEEDDLLIIEYKDNGPGIEKHLIDSQIIFEPEFSGKTGTSGTGLGLAISGEALARNDAIIKAIYNETGAFFKIEIKNTK
ncbi:MAG: ATP-binding region ATPase domain protein [Chitinophagaceae bacterium]|nr:ATP-binding region ATPase domain protein [Chitinophagaceae bacterium]